MLQQLNRLRYSTSKKNFTFYKTSFHHRKLNMKHLLLCCDHVFSNEQNTEHSHIMDGKDSGWARAQLLWCHINHMLGHVPGDYIWPLPLCEIISQKRAEALDRWLTLASLMFCHTVRCFKGPNSCYHVVMPRQGAWGITPDWKYSCTARDPMEE